MASDGPVYRMLGPDPSTQLIVPYGLFVTDVQGGVIEMKNVVMNSAFATSRFFLISLCDRQMKVTLSSNLGEQIGFLINREGDPGNEIGSFNHNDFTVNCIQEVTLNPKQVLPVVVAFKPIKQKTSKASKASSLSFEDEQSNLVSGRIFLSGTVIGSNSHQRQTSQLSQQDNVIRFQATVMQSSLRSDTSCFFFENCIPGQTYLKDFSVWNLSEVACPFKLSVESSDTEVLTLSNAGSGLPFEMGLIPRLSHRPIQLRFTPRQVGEFEFRIRLENVFEETSASILHVKCRVLEEQEAEGLSITGLSPEGLLDFGNCYDGVPVQRCLSVRNATSQGLTVQLKVEDCREGDVVFFSTRRPADTGHSKKTAEKGKHLSEMQLLVAGSEERDVLVTFCPSLSRLSLAQKTKLCSRDFHVRVKSEDARSSRAWSIMFTGKSRACASVVGVSPSDLFLGECNVGSISKGTIKVTNHSDLPARVSAQVTSAAVFFKEASEDVEVAPHQSHLLHLEVCPCRVNPSYRKQIRIENLLDPRNHSVVHVHADFQDRHHVLLHSLFYRLDTPAKENWLLFDQVVLNSPSTLSMVVENTTKQPIHLKFSSSLPTQLTLYEAGSSCSHSSGRRAELPNVQSADVPPGLRASTSSRDQLLESLESSQALCDPTASISCREGQMEREPLGLAATLAADRHQSPLPGTQASSLVRGGSGDMDGSQSGYSKGWEKKSSMKRVRSSLLIAGGSAQDPARQEHPPKECSQRALACVGHVAAAALGFSGEEKEFVEAQMHVRSLAMAALSSPLAHGMLPVERLQLLPGQAKSLTVALTLKGSEHPSIQGRLTDLPATVFVHLDEYDGSVLQALDPQLFGPSWEGGVQAREIPVLIRACRVKLALAQKSLNFGRVFTNEHRSKMLLLRNCADVPLLYKIRKTGSIASGDIHLVDGRTGVVQPRCSREVNFVFQPSFAGAFRETLSIHNVLDPSMDQEVVMKASITRAETFEVSVSNLDMGVVSCSEWSPTHSIVVKNISKQGREFVLKASDLAEAESDRHVWGPSFFDVQPKLGFLLEQTEAGECPALSPDEEALAALRKKLEAYWKKGKSEKAGKVERQIKDLSAQLAHSRSSPDAENEAGTEATTNSDVSVGVGKPEEALWAEGTVSFLVKPHQSQGVLVRCLVPIILDLENAVQRVHGSFLVYESKNRDVVKTVSLSCTACRDMDTADTLRAGGAAGNGLLPFSSSRLLYSVSLSPESSVPTSPQGPSSQAELQTLLGMDMGALVAAHSHSRSLSPSPSPSPNPSPSLESATVMGGPPFVDPWGPEQRVLSWGLGMAEESEGEDYVVEASDVSSADGSRPGSDGEAADFEVFVNSKTDPGVPSSVGNDQQPGFLDSCLSVDLSSAAAMAHSLSMEARGGLGLLSAYSGLLLLEDSWDCSGMEGSITVISHSVRDELLLLEVEWSQFGPQVEALVQRGSETKQLKLEPLEAPAKPASMQRHCGPVWRWQLPLKSREAVVITVKALDGTDSSLFSATGVLKLEAGHAHSTRRQLEVKMKAPAHMLCVQPREVTFLGLEVASVAQQRISVRNRGSQRTAFSVEVGAGADRDAVSGVSVSPISGVLEPYETAVLTVQCAVHRPGRLVQQLCVRSEACSQASAVLVTAVVEKVKFIELVGQEEGRVLDLGHCYVNQPAAGSMAPLCVRNVSAAPLLLRFRSNLMKQAFVSLDSSGAARLEDKLLGGGESLRLFLLLRPRGEQAAYEHGQCRRIVGGMHIQAFLLEAGGSQEAAPHPVDELTVPFRALAGKSLLQVSSSFVDLGVVNEVGGCLSASFVVSNPSHHLPLTLELDAGTVKLAVARVELRGKHSDQPGLSDSACIAFWLPIEDYGLIEDVVSIRNVTCEGQAASVKLQVFVDDGSILFFSRLPAQPPLAPLRSSASSLCLGSQSPCRGLKKSRSMAAVCGSAADVEECYLSEELPRPASCLHLGEIFVVPDPEVGRGCLRYQLAHAGHEPLAFFVLSAQQQPVYVLPLSNLPVTVHDCGGDLQPPGDFSWFKGCKLASGYEPCGPPIVLHPHRLAKLALQFCPGSRALSAANASRLSKGQRCHFEGFLLLYRFYPSKSIPGAVLSPPAASAAVLPEDEGSGQYERVVELLRVDGAFCLSTAELLSSRVDLGRVGRSNSWQDVQFEVVLRNTSCARLDFRVASLPQPFSVPAMPAGGGCVAPEALASLPFVFRPSFFENLTKSESMRWTVRIVNEHNPYNALEFEVLADISVRPMSFGGLVHKALRLPAILLHHLRQHQACASAFTIENSGADPMQVRVDFEPSPETDSLFAVTLEASLSSASKWPFELSVGPFGVSEVSVSALSLDAALLEGLLEDGSPGVAVAGSEAEAMVCLGRITVCNEPHSPDIIQLLQPVIRGLPPSSLP